MTERGMEKSECGAYVLNADAQATIAALQARFKYLCRFIWGEEGTFTFPDGDTIDIRKGQSREQLEQQLTQRTAELERVEKELAEERAMMLLTNEVLIPSLKHRQGME